MKFFFPSDVATTQDANIRCLYLRDAKSKQKQNFKHIFLFHQQHFSFRLKSHNIKAEENENSNAMHVISKQFL